MYLILALCTGKTMDLNLPVCGLHHKDQKRSAWLARIMLLAFAPVGIATGVYFSEILGWVTGGLLLLVSLIHVHDAALGISVARIDNDGGVFKGACNEFLNLLPADPEFRS
jgi:hypothetical protein